MKKKTFRIIALLLVLTTVALVFASCSGSKNKDKDKLQEPAPVYSFSDSAYTKAVSVSGANGEIFLPSDIANVYFTADLAGNVKFYDCADGAFAASTLPVKQVKANLAATYEKIPVTVNYIEKDGKTFGIGVFTSDMSADVKVYSYAFVKLINKPSGYGTGHLLLADFEKHNFYSADKTYSEIYNFDLASGKTSTYVSNNTRLIDKNGAFRADWTMLTDDFIANLGGAKYFLSSRYYTSAEKGTRADIMVLSDAYRPEIVAKDILGTWFVNDANGMHYLRKTGKGFSNVINQGKSETVLDEFDGDYFTDYLQDGRWLINKKSLVVTDLMTGAKKTLKGINIAGFDRVYASADGAKFVFAGNGAKNENGVTVQKVIYCTADGSKNPVAYNEPLLFNESSGFVWIDAGRVMSVRALDGTGAKVGSVIYAY